MTSWSRARIEFTPAQLLAAQDAWAAGASRDTVRRLLGGVSANTLKRVRREQGWPERRQGRPLLSPTLPASLPPDPPAPFPEPPPMGSSAHRGGRDTHKLPSHPGGEKPDDSQPVQRRCERCQQRTSADPCEHCGTAWREP